MTGKPTECSSLSPPNPQQASLISAVLHRPAPLVEQLEQTDKLPPESETERCLALLIGQNWWPF